MLVVHLMPAGLAFDTSRKPQHHLLHEGVSTANTGDRAGVHFLRCTICAAVGEHSCQ